MNLFKVGVVAASLALAGCSWLPWHGGDVDAQVAEVQAKCKEACKFLPAAQTITAIFAAADPSVASASAVASAICAAVNASMAKTPEGAKTAPECPYGKVAGVCIQGQPL